MSPTKPSTVADSQYPDPETQPLNPDPPSPPIPASSGMGSDDQFVRPEGRPGDVAALWAARVSVAVFVITTWAITLSSNPSSLGLFFFHPILQSFSIAMFTYGILTLQPTSQPKTKAAGLTRHQLAMAAAAVPAIGLGTLAIILRKALANYPHFTTWHGTFGIIAVSWLVVQVVLGAGSVWFGGRLFGGNPKAKLVWKYHRLSGYLLFPLFLFTAHLGGAWSTWMTGASGFALRLVAYTISPIVLVVAVLSRARTSKMKFF